MRDGPPTKRHRKVPPAIRKARDVKRQRKIASNGSDKASRKNAPLHKAIENRRFRRKSPGTDAEARAVLRTRVNHWGTESAAERRQARDAERAWLDATPVRKRRGRGRYPAHGGDDS